MTINELQFDKCTIKFTILANYHLKENFGQEKYLEVIFSIFFLSFIYRKYNVKKLKKLKKNAFLGRARGPFHRPWRAKFGPRAPGCRPLS